MKINPKIVKMFFPFRKDKPPKIIPVIANVEIKLQKRLFAQIPKCTITPAINTCSTDRRIVVIPKRKDKRTKR